MLRHRLWLRRRLVLQVTLRMRRKRRPRLLLRNRLWLLCRRALRRRPRRWLHNRMCLRCRRVLHSLSMPTRRRRRPRIILLRHRLWLLRRRRVLHVGLPIRRKWRLRMLLHTRMFLRHGGGALAWPSGAQGAAPGTPSLGAQV